jgi:hypothetical protein
VWDPEPVPYSTITWVSSGYTGSPGYTKLKFMGTLDTAGANAAAANSRTFIASMGIYTPTIVSYACQSTCQTFSDAGVLTGEVAITALPSNIGNSASGSYICGAGAVVYWLTGALNGGHKVKGRTYLVPLSANAFATDGTLLPNVVTALQNAATALVGSTPNLAVNSRKLGQDDRGDQTNVVSSAQVKDRSAFLRTRRT